MLLVSNIQPPTPLPLPTHIMPHEQHHPPASSSHDSVVPNSPTSASSPTLLEWLQNRLYQWQWVHHVAVVVVTEKIPDRRSLRRRWWCRCRGSGGTRTTWTWWSFLWMTWCWLEWRRKRRNKNGKSPGTPFEDQGNHKVFPDILIYPKCGVAENTISRGWEYHDPPVVHPVGGSIMIHRLFTQRWQRDKDVVAWITLSTHRLPRTKQPVQLMLTTHTYSGVKCRQEQSPTETAYLFGSALSATLRVRFRYRLQAGAPHFSTHPFGGQLVLAQPTELPVFWCYPLTAHMNHLVRFLTPPFAKKQQHLTGTPVRSWRTEGTSELIWLW